MSSLETPVAPSVPVELEIDRDQTAELAERANRQAARRLRAYWILGLGSVAIVVLLAAAAFYVERSALNRPAWEITERLEQEGLPTTWEAAQAAAPKPPEKLDGSAEWNAFLETFNRSVGEFDRLAPDVGLRESVAWRAALKELVASGTYRVASYPTSRVTESDYMVGLPELDAENAMGRFLVELAKKRHDDGDFDGAAESLALALALAANMKYEPFLVCRLSGASRFGYAADVIEPLLVQREVSSDRLVELQQALERCDLEAGLEWMRLHELLIQRDYAIDGGFSDVELNPLEARLARHSLLRQLELLDRLRVVQTLPPSERLEQMTEIDVEYGKLVEEEEAYTTQRLANVVHSDFRSMNVRQDLMFVESGIRRRLLIAAIACRRFEHDHEELPKDWKDLVDYGVAEAPTNPWTEQPMTIRRLADGSVAIESPWTEPALEAYEERRADDDRKPCQEITLPPSAKP